MGRLMVNITEKGLGSKDGCPIHPKNNTNTAVYVLWCLGYATLSVAAYGM